jgi:para-aminobenzoate synthetase
MMTEIATEWSTEEIFSSVFADVTPSFWLDSSNGDRFSILGNAAGPLARTHRGGLPQALPPQPDPFDVPFDFRLGWVGNLGYEQETSNWVYPDRALVVDHLDNRAWLLILDHPENRSWLAETTQLLTTSQPQLTSPRYPTPARPWARHSERDYLKLIDAALEEIEAGESYEICLCNELSAPFDGDPLDAYRILRGRHRSSFGAFFACDDYALASLSPERFLRIDRHRIIESKPIKGTRPRVGDDDEVRAELAGNVKDRAENLMIVDLVRNDLAKVSVPGTVHVPTLFDVETYPTVHQLVSTVRSTQRPDVTPVEVLQAAFPPGSMTGAPKLRTMRIITELENGPRGPYSGALGYFSTNGTADFSVVIRTLTFHPNKVHYGTGGAIVALSIPTTEYTETQTKSIPLRDLMTPPTFGEGY